MYKKAGLEESSLVDSRTNLKIEVSTSVRLKYRQYYSGQLGRNDYRYLSNVELNDIIAQDFSASGGNAFHMFLARSSDLQSKKRNWIEIRKVLTTRPFNFFFSIIGFNYIGIISVSTRYKKPKKLREPVKSVRLS